MTAGDGSIAALCPECNVMAALQVRSEVHGSAPRQLWDQLDGTEEGLRTARYQLAFCSKCGSVFLRITAESEPSEIPYSAILYPKTERRSVPGLLEPARRAYESAQSCFATGFTNRV
jgi:hypothetical protein